MDLAQIIGVAGVLLILFGAPLLYAAKAVGGFIAARIPKRTPVSFAGIFSAKLSIEWWKVFVLAGCLWLMAGGGGLKLPGLPSWPSFPSITQKATAAVYVYEKDSGGVPPFVGAAIGKLNERPGFIATTHEDDATNKTGGVPKQYEFALPAARAAGLPAFVTMAANRSVLKVVSKPTEPQLVEAVP